MNELTVGRIDLGPTEARHLTQTEQRMMDGALRQSLKIIPDPEVERLRALCSEVYQVVGMLASMSGSFEDDAVDAVLTNLSDAAEGRPLTHESVIPFYPVGWREKMDAANG